MFLASDLGLAIRFYAVGSRRTIRRLLWDGLAVMDGACAIEHECLLLDGQQTATFADLKRRLAQVRKGQLQSPGSFVVRSAGRVLVEPRYGWAIAGRARLEDLSLTYGWETHSWKGREWLGLPSAFAVFGANLAGRQVPELACAVSLLSPWPENYFHFVTDVLPKLLACEDAGVPPTIPLLVSAGLARQGFFQEARLRGPLRKRQIVVVDQPMRVGQLYMAHGRPLDLTTARRLLALLGHEAAASAAGNRIFVTRSPARGRTIENFHELVPSITAAGFRIVDLDELSFDEQLALFGTLEMLAGIHGAGLVNMIFALGHRLPVFEVIPSGRDDEMDCFRQISGALGFPFTRIHGDPGPFRHKRATFRVDPVRFQAALSTFVATHACAGTLDGPSALT